MFYGDVDNSGIVNTGSAGQNQDFVDNGANQVFSADTCVDCVECQPYGIAGYLLGLIAFGTLVPKFFGGTTRTASTKKKIAKTSDIDKKLKAEGTVIRKAESKKMSRQLSNYRKTQKNDKITINVN